MARYECSVCGYVYDEAKEPVKWADLPDDWVCPTCGSPKSAFERLDSDATRQTVSPAGRFLMAHRVFGYVFLVTYLFFLWQMVPRLWTYQIEFPARTVVHIALGMGIGAALLLKIVTVRFFRRFDPNLVNTLGASLFTGTVILIGISAPFAFHEAIVTRASAAEGLFAEDSLQRVRVLLAQTGLELPQCDRYGSPESLSAGRDVLRNQCVQCHDLRTVLARPRTPENWLQTVRRMADRMTVSGALTKQQQWQVTAYLIALSPQLQRSTQNMRAQEAQSEKAKEAVQAATGPDAAAAAFDPEQAKGLFETKCSMCHPPTLVGMAPPASKDEARSLVAQMVGEGLIGTEAELGQIIEHITRTYVPGSDG